MNKNRIELTFTCRIGYAGNRDYKGSPQAAVDPAAVKTGA
jgi:hypothetical protein